MGILVGTGVVALIPLVMLSRLDHRLARSKLWRIPHAFGFRPGVDLDRLNQLADELEAEESVAKLSR